MKKIILLFCFSIASYAEYPVKITLNADSCKVDTSNEYQICLFNNTGESLNSREFELSRVIVFSNGSEGGFIEYTNWQPNHYINIEISKPIFTAGTESGYPKKIYFKLQKNFSDIPDCQFGWMYDTPPYYTTPVFHMIKKDGNIACQYK